MTNLKIFLVTYDRLDSKIMKELTTEEKQSLVCYSVNQGVLKNISARIPIVNEWQLPWYTPRYQTLQYYEYGCIAHCFKNEDLIKDMTHIGLMHYDMYFPKDSINDIKKELDENPNVIYYNTLRKNNQLFLTKEQFEHICNFIDEKLDLNIDKEFVWNNNWISEAISIVPVDVYKKFGKFIIDNQYEIENMLNSNKWGLMNAVKHRLCGFTERLWGIYLVSLGLELKQMNIIHDWESYKHQHLVDKENFLKKF